MHAVLYKRTDINEQQLLLLRTYNSRLLVH